MFIRQISQRHWEHVYRQITTHGRAAPLSLQFDIVISCNGVDYILKVQPESKRKIVALQALGIYPNNERNGGKDYHLIEDYLILSALLEIIIYQGTGKRKAAALPAGRCPYDTEKADGDSRRTAIQNQPL